MNPIELLREITQSIEENGEPTTDAVDYIVTCLKHPNPQVVIYAVSLTTLFLRTEHLSQVLAHADSFALNTRMAIAARLCRIDDDHTGFKYLFEELKKTTDATYTEVLITCLGHADYPIYPYLEYYLTQATLADLPKFKRVIQAMGLQKIAPYIALYRDIPNENILRDVFGDESIESIKA